MIALSQIPVFNSSDFGWTGHHGYVNASDMPADIGITDAFAVRSVRTGEIRLFEFAHATTEPDGRVVGWVFDSNSGDNFTSITVWNDYGTLNTNDLGNF